MQPGKPPSGAPAKTSPSNKLEEERRNPVVSREGNIQPDQLHHESKLRNISEKLFGNCDCAKTQKNRPRTSGLPAITCAN
jgi:hypothetical protein